MIKKLEEWYKKYSKWLDERNIEGNLKHEKTIKAYRSIRRNLESLYTYERYPDLNLPKTNNYVESLNSKIEEQIKIHR
jgi:transposase-like protein